MTTATGHSQTTATETDGIGTADRRDGGRTHAVDGAASSTVESNSGTCKWITNTGGLLGGSWDLTDAVAGSLHLAPGLFVRALLGSSHGCSGVAIGPRSPFGGEPR